MDRDQLNLDLDQDKLGSNQCWPRTILDVNSNWTRTSLAVNKHLDQDQHKVKGITNKCIGIGLIEIISA